MIYDEEEDENHYRVEYSRLNEDRLKPYSRIDFSINYRPEYKLLRKAKIEFSLSILNLWNSENIFAREYYVESDDTINGPNLAFIRKSLLQTTPLVLCRMYW